MAFLEYVAMWVNPPPPLAGARIYKYLTPLPPTPFTNRSAMFIYSQSKNKESNGGILISYQLVETPLAGCLSVYASLLSLLSSYIVCVPGRVYLLSP